MRRRVTLALCLLAALSARAASNITCISTADKINDAKTFWTPARREISSPQQLEAYPSALLMLRRSSSIALFSLGASIASRFSGGPSVNDANTATPPFDAAGRLYFRDINGASDYCTAAFTNDPDIILTAAHCVRQLMTSGSKFHSNFLFTRVYDHGSGEDFDILLVATVDEWVKPTANRHDYDYAFLLTKQSVTGVTPLTMVPSTPSDWTAVGYPAPPAGDKKTMRYDSGSRRVATTKLIMENVEMGNGASGGPWIPFDPYGAIGTEVFAVASTLGPNIDTLAGAMLTARAQELFDFVQARCTDDQ